MPKMSATSATVNARRSSGAGCVRAQSAQASEQTVHAAPGSVRMTPTSPSAAASEPAGWVSRNLHSTVPSGHRTPVRSAGTDWLPPASNVR